MLTFLVVLSLSAGAAYVVEALNIECNDDQRPRFEFGRKAAKKAYKESYAESVPGALRQF